MEEPSPLPEVPASNSTLSSRLFTLLVALAITVVVYFRVIDFDFVLWDDDIHIHTNRFLNPVTWNHLAQFWIHPFHGLYIPVAYTIFSVIAIIAHRQAPVPYTAALVNLDPHVFHEANLLVHLVNVALVYLLLNRLSKSPAGSVLGAFLYSIHPLQVESVAWVSEMRGLSCTLFMLLSIHCYLSALKRTTASPSPQFNANYLDAIMLFVVALLCKPTATCEPLLLIVFARYFSGFDLRRSVVSALPFVLIAGVMVLVTRNVQSIDPAAIAPIWQRPFIAGDALAFYITKLFVPINLAMDYGRTPQVVMAHWWGYATWLLPAILAFCVWRLRDKYPSLAFASLLFVAVLLPVLGLVPFVYQGYSTVADRYASLALLGPALLIASWSASAKGRIPVLATTAVLLILCALSVQQTKTWHNSISLFTQAVKIDPESGFDHNNLAAAYMQVHDYTGALPQCRIAARLKPNVPDVHLGLGDCLMMLGQKDEGMTELRKSVALDPKFVSGLDDLGSFLIQNGKIDEGLEMYRRASLVDIHNPVNFNNLGTALAQVGRYHDALAAFKGATDVDYAFLPAHVNLALLYSELNKPSDAIYECNAILKIDPKNELAYANRGASYMQMGQYSPAAGDFRQALALDPSDDSARAGLAQASEKGM